jgi:hypothetical protein
VQAVEMLGKAEDGGALRRLVRADPLEDPGSVVEAVRPDVHRRVGPVDELAVEPDLLGFAHTRLLMRRMTLVS